jgi:hypothetical protein
LNWFSTNTASVNNVNWRIQNAVNDYGLLEFVRSTTQGALPSVTAMSLSSAGLLTVSGFGTHSFSGSGAGAQTLKVANSNTGSATDTAGIQFDVDAAGLSTTFKQFSGSFTTSGANIAAASQWLTGGVGGLTLVALNGSGPIKFYTGGSNLRWGINPAGDFTIGPSARIALSNGTPFVSSGFGTGSTVTGTDYAFTISLGTGANTGGTISFGHTWSTAPVCTGSLDVQGNIKSGAVNGFNFSPHPTTATMSISYDSTTAPSQLFYVVCFSS